MTLSLFLPVGFLLLQCAVFALAPARAGQTSYVFMVVAPLLAALAVVRRACREQGPARFGWATLALALAVWALGAFGNLWHELVLGRAYEMYRDAMLAFNLAVVPVIFLVASDWHGARRRLTRAIDAVLAFALGYAYFLVTWSMLTARGEPDADGVATMLWLMDAQNLVVAAGAVVRWLAADEAPERALFRAIGVYTVAYGVVAAANNHLVAGNAAFGPETSSIVTVVFALLAAAALRPAPVEPPLPRSVRFVRAVRSARSLFLAGTLLLVALFLIRSEYVPGLLGVLIAVLGYGLRSTVTQVRHIEREDRLRRDRSELQAIAWTDALTGISNRRYLDRALDGICGTAVPTTQTLSVLMIDIDHFKLLNDRFGHPAGDACLRDVAAALRLALARPSDVLARYGGEEFIALLLEADRAGAGVVAERLRAAVQALGLPNPGSPVGVVTVSIGVASTGLPASTPGPALIAAADKALYDAKCAGRNQVRFWPVAA